MDSKTIRATRRMIMVSLGFTMLLLSFRIAYSGTLSYIFYVWNLFLALVPLFFSGHLHKEKKIGARACLLIAGWLLFFPNAPYVITDIFHYRERWPVPKWYDLLLVVSAGWNGLMLGFISLLQVEQFLIRVVNKKRMLGWLSVFIFLCGYGIYIGRFLRFNSWDLVTDPFSLLATSAQHFLDPLEHIVVWKFTVLFAMTLAVIFYGIRQLGTMNTRVEPGDSR